MIHLLDTPWLACITFYSPNNCTSSNAGTCLLSFVVLTAGLDKDCRLTEPLGMRIAEFPLNPMFAKMLLESGRWRPAVLIDFILSGKLFLKFCVSWGRGHNVACASIFFKPEGVFI